MTATIACFPVFPLARNLSYNDLHADLFSLHSCYAVQHIPQVLPTSFVDPGLTLHATAASIFAGPGSLNFL
ncbi:MAG: hypothetical protein EOO07_38690 [Chitinophagaceae bacterium]|nr:MAG: hypothetical protein EOO07_38690 [Chitinophagaceae bacterium]